MRVLKKLNESIRRYFVAGILTFAPIGITLWALAWIIERLDNLLLPRLLRLAPPSMEKWLQLPLIGAVFTLLVILIFGVIARHFFGLKLVKFGEQVLRRVPIARSIYVGVNSSRRQSSHPNRVQVLEELPLSNIQGTAFSLSLSLQDLHGGW